MKYDLIVIGGGPAGVTAALRARELGATAALVERGRMGGVCTNDGCAPTRVLAKAARLVRDAAQFDEYGLEGAAPAVNLPALLARTQQTVYRLQEKKQLLAHLAEGGVDVLAEAGPARFVDAHSLEVGSSRLEAERFIICAGGRARRLAFPGAEHCLTHSDVWTMDQAPETMAIVGGAATGCQLASIFSAFGAEVTILDVAPRLLPGEDAAISQAIARSFERHNIRLITAIGGIERVEPDGAGLALRYRSGLRSETLPVAAVVLAVGWVGQVEELNLAAAGVESERGYVQVNDFLQTTAGHIFAAGDITGRMMLVQSAGYEARVAAENAVLGPTQRYEHHIVPHGGFTDPEYGSVGLVEAEARGMDDCVVAVVPYADLDRAVIDDRTEGFCKLIVSATTGRVLGAHVVGEQAVEVVQMVATGMAAGIHVEALAEAQLAYPTFTAIVGLAARQIAREMGVVAVAREWQTLRRVRAEWESPAA